MGSGLFVDFTFSNSRTASLCGIAGAMVLALPAVMPGVAEAQTSASNAASPQRAERTFDIPAQTLAKALIQFGEQANVQLTIDADLVSGKLANAVNGRLPVEAALQQLLAGLGLEYRFLSAN